MTRLASLRFDRVLDERECADITRALVSAGTTARTWKRTRTQTFATLALEAHASHADVGRVAPSAVVALPPELVLRVRPDARHRASALVEAFGGAGALGGVRDVRLDGDACVVTCDPGVTSAALVLASIEAELARAPGRAIEPLVELDDASLAALAGAVLGEPRLDASRILDAYVDAAVAAAR